MAIFAIDRNTKPEDAMYWHVTGKHPHPQIDTTEPNCMNQIVEWIRDDSVPLLQKVGMAALGILSTLAIGYVVGKMFLVTTVVTVITLLWAKREAVETDRKEAQMIEEAKTAEKMLAEQRAALEKVKELLGGNEAYEALPNLDLGGRMGDRGYIDFLEPEDLAHPLMKGNDKFGRPFFALKIHSNDPVPAQGVLIGFQKYTEGGLWVYKGTNGRFDEIKDREFNEIRQIRTNQHPAFRLAV